MNKTTKSIALVLISSTLVFGGWGTPLCFTNRGLNSGQNNTPNGTTVTSQSSNWPSFFYFGGWHNYYPSGPYYSPGPYIVPVPVAPYNPGPYNPSPAPAPHVGNGIPAPHPSGGAITRGGFGGTGVGIGSSSGG